MSIDLKRLEAAYVSMHLKRLFAFAGRPPGRYPTPGLEYEVCAPSPGDPRVRASWDEDGTTSCLLALYDDRLEFSRWTIGNASDRMDEVVTLQAIADSGFAALEDFSDTIDIGTVEDGRV